ncbi:MAG: hypothetical protein QM519_02340 [Bacteroidia bacterium]|nr:hypothetical protein [Bacteroidia bacterium]
MPNTSIAKGSWEKQRLQLEAWLTARGGKWTAWLALAALEGWRLVAGPAVRDAIEKKQSQQLDFSTVIPVAPKKGAKAYGDVWAQLQEIAVALKGVAVVIPEPSEALCKEVLNRYARRVAKPPVKVPLPGGGKPILGPLAWIALAAAVATYEE